MTVRLHNKVIEFKLFLNTVLYAGEAYMDGTLTIEEGELEDLMALFLTNASSTRPTWMWRST